ncbi:hypothetical protein JMJ78_0000984 [Colletotrichum scovillei]|nr:hypothetical protein JMJ78_0000984 [Colletotrichum scovillei]
MRSHPKDCVVVVSSLRKNPSTMPTLRYVVQKARRSKVWRLQTTHSGCMGEYDQSVQSAVMGRLRRQGVDVVPEGFARTLVQMAHLQSQWNAEW